ncbi:FKBP-type peptidyl-prolyl cis-trans isomerase [Flavobacterium sp.]|uniref:FKBP-type peptidyl-prolyl cis-trans isomerase n=1 Tax=Flavobacterium sp. TaxID=239 RepID=UPI002B4AE184|nr:FKBP-type peptidyl-prolyl cis-trans isomerase [Flavobacterium sp.]HLF53433.1 FKBP-type peptidyl-prolyl cis-trans isomerase [Flavobacterium sp.]
MNKIHKLFLILTVGILFASCVKDDEQKVEPLRDYTEQYNKDLDSLDKYIDTHYITVDADYNVTMTKIPVGGTQESIRIQDDYPLVSKMVQNDDHDVNYKVYYIKLREGVNETPTAVDSVYVSYKGNLVSDFQFDYAQNPVWFQLEDVVPGWAEIIPLFKTGNYDTAEGPNPTAFTEFGAGVMFLPSGLGYYNMTTSAGTIGAYSPLIFSFKLNKLRYKDHDRDGVLSKDEVDPTIANQKPIDYDSDGDGFANMFDLDDDGDNILTKNEIHKNLDGTIIFEDCDGDGIPNYLDPTICP